MASLLPTHLFLSRVQHFIQVLQIQRNEDILLNLYVLCSQLPTSSKSFICKGKKLNTTPWVKSKQSSAK